MITQSWISLLTILKKDQEPRAVPLPYRFFSVSTLTKYFCKKYALWSRTRNLNHIIESCNSVKYVLVICISNPDGSCACSCPKNLFALREKLNICMKKVTIPFIFPPFPSGTWPRLKFTSLLGEALSTTHNKGQMCRGVPCSRD